MSGATKVASTTTWAPFQRGRPLATTSGRPGSTFSAAGLWLLLRGLRERSATGTQYPKMRVCRHMVGKDVQRRPRQTACARGSGIRCREKQRATETMVASSASWKPCHKGRPFGHGLPASSSNSVTANTWKNCLSPKDFFAEKPANINYRKLHISSLLCPLLFLKCCTFVGPNHVSHRFQ